MSGQLEKHRSPLVCTALSGTIEIKQVCIGKYPPTHLLRHIACSNEVGGNLGWVNAERNGVIDAIRTLTHNECACDEDQMGGSADEEAEEDARDGRFTCEVCGRSE